MSCRFRVFCSVLVCLAASLAVGAEPGKYVPDTLIENLIGQASQRDAVTAQAAVERLSGLGDAATQALNWHLFKESSPSASLRWAELLARCGRGRVAYRSTIELQPDGSGMLQLWSDRAQLAECGKRFARINGQPEPLFTDDDLRHNPYGKAELLKHLNDAVKFQEARVETHGDSIQAMGMLSFKNFDSFSTFADSFDADGYNMIAGSTLTDANGTRTFQYRTVAEEDHKQYEKNMLLFHSITWEFVLDFKGRTPQSNATRTDGTRLIWVFNCYQMLTGKAVVQVTYDGAGLVPRPAAKKDEAIAIPAVAQPNLPTAVVSQAAVRVKVCRKTPEGPRKKEILRELNQLVELDGSGSLPRSESLQYQWTQVGGADLNLNEQALAKASVPLVIKEAGEYRFELIVLANGVYSKPAEVKVFVEEDERPTAVASTENPAAAVPASAKPPEPAATKPPEPAATKPPEVVTPVKPEAVQPSPEAPANATPEPKATVARDPAKAKELYEQAQKLMKAFKYAEAKPLLLEAAQLNPEDRECVFNLGVTLLELNEIPAALVRFQEVADATRNPRAYMYIGHCNARAKNLGEAGRWYRKGAAIGKGAVEWESRWQLGNNSLRDKEYKDALDLLLDADRSAAQANIKDYRLMRDLALTYHAMGRDEEALSPLLALQELGYTPDPKLVAEIKEKAAKMAAAKPPVEPVKTAEVPPAAVAVPKNDPPPVAKVEPPPVAKIDPPVSPVKSSAKTPEPDKNTSAAIVDLNKLETNKKPVAVAPAPVAQAAPVKETPTAPQPVKVQLPPPEPVKVADVKPAPPHAPETKPEPAAVPPVAKETKAVKKAKPKPVVVKKPLPPVPDDFAQALAAGRKAMEEGARLATQTSEESKQKATEHFDEAEAMFQGAWAKKLDDENVMTAFKELAKHVRVIAIPRNPSIKVKERALAVLDAGLSIVPADKPIYCVWEQVGGEDLGIRPEQMAMKVLHLPRNTRPGVYTFELAVSDGTRGGNPVTVTVEVTE